jgi:hypothetical protein
MTTRIKKRMGLFHEVLLSVEGEILAVGIPVWLFKEYETPDEFMSSVHFRGIEEAAARLGTDEIHFSSLNKEYPCFGEVTLRGCEDGEGWWFTEWGEWVEETIREARKKKQEKGVL